MNNTNDLNAELGDSLWKSGSIRLNPRGNAERRHWEEKITEEVSGKSGTMGLDGAEIEKKITIKMENSMEVLVDLVKKYIKNSRILETRIEKLESNLKIHELPFYRVSGSPAKIKENLAPDPKRSTSRRGLHSKDAKSGVSLRSSNILNQSTGSFNPRSKDEVPTSDIHERELRRPKRRASKHAERLPPSAQAKN
jgi:hypothetical protein